MHFLNVASFTNGQPQSTLSGHANKHKLWFISSLRTLRAETSCIPKKNRDLLCPHEKCLCAPTTNLPLKFAFSLKTSDRGCNLCERLGKQTFRKLKITLVASTYPGQRPQCPSVPPHVLLSAGMFAIMSCFYLQTQLYEFCFYKSTSGK